jgi:peptidoglycan/LPS O-acetylase OafA/YrhL
VPDQPLTSDRATKPTHPGVADVAVSSLLPHGLKDSGASAEVARVDLASSASGAPRLDYVDGVRALAAVYVVLHHIWLEIWPVEFQVAPTGLAALLTSWLGYGHFAVSVFIVVSGFCLMLPVVRNGGVLKGGYLKFIKRRAWRILPTYYAALAISLLLVFTLIGTKTGTHWDIAIPVTSTDVVDHVILLQDLTANARINHALWSIAVEWRIYFFFPPLVLLARRISMPITLAIAFLIAYPLARQFLTPFMIANAMPQYFALFALGMLAATITFAPRSGWTSLRNRLPWTLLATACLVALCVVNGAMASHSIGQVDVGYLDLLAGGGTLSLLIGLSRPGHNPLRALFGWRPLVSVGAMSYSLYLIHAPLVHLVWQYVVHPLHLQSGEQFAVLLILGVPFCIAAALVFYLAFERPFLTRTSPAVPAYGRLVSQRRRLHLLPSRD